MRMTINLKEKMMRGRNKKIIWGFGILIALVASFVWSLYYQGTETDTAIAERGDINKYVEEIGEVKCKDATTVYLEGNGLIQNIYVEEEQ